MDRTKTTWRSLLASAHRVCALVLLVITAAPALADEILPEPSTPEAVAHLKEGNKLYQLREYEKAAAAYKAGVKAEPKPSFTFWYNLGQTYRQWGKYEDAIWFYSQFIKAAPPTLKLHRQASENFIVKMRAELERSASTATPTDTAPTPMRDPAPASGTQPPPRASPASMTPAPLANTKLIGEPWYRDTTGWLLVGTGVAATATGLGLLVNGSSIRDEADHEPRVTVRDALYDKASTRTTLGAVVGGAGLIALGVGVVKLTINDRKTSATEAVRVTVGSRWISIQGSF